MPRMFHKSLSIWYKWQKRHNKMTIYSHFRIFFPLPIHIFQDEITFSACLAHSSWLSQGECSYIQTDCAIMQHSWLLSNPLQPCSSFYLFWRIT
jgi:hypothetical protein